MSLPKTPYKSPINIRTKKLWGESETGRTIWGVAIPTTVAPMEYIFYSLEQKEEPTLSDVMELIRTQGRFRAYAVIRGWANLQVKDRSVPITAITSSLSLRRENEGDHMTTNTAQRDLLLYHLYGITEIQKRSKPLTEELIKSGYGDYFSPTYNKPRTENEKRMVIFSPTGVEMGTVNIVKQDDSTWIVNHVGGHEPLKGDTVKVEHIHDDWYKYVETTATKTKYLFVVLTTNQQRSYVYHRLNSLLTEEIRETLSCPRYDADGSLLVLDLEKLEQLDSLNEIMKFCDNEPELSYIALERPIYS